MNAYQDMLNTVQPPAYLPREVLDRARAMRRDPCDAVPPVVVVREPERRPLYSRRGFVAIGACAALGMAGAGVALLAHRPTAQKPTTVPVGFSAVTPESQQPITARASLAIMEPQNPGPQALPATDEGMAWWNAPSVASGSTSVLINLSMRGDAIASVCYSLEGGSEAGRDAVALTEAVQGSAGPNGDQSRRYYGSMGSAELLEATLAQDGSPVLPQGGMAAIDASLPVEVIRSVDPVCDAYWEWNDVYQKTVLPPDATDEEREQTEAICQEAGVLQRRLDAMLNELYADIATFYAWMRTCHIDLMELLGSQIAQTTLCVEVTFTDGTQETHRYRLGMVDDFADACGERFDALMDSSPYNLAESRGLYSEVDGCWEIAGLPSWFFINGLPYPDAVAQDPRLERPLFTITEIFS